MVEEAVAEATTEETSNEETTETEDWKSHARKHEREAKKLRKELEARDAKLSELTEATQSETEKAIEKARKEAAAAAKAEVSGAYRTRILNAEIRAQAAGKFANPKLAAKLLDLDADALFDDDGEIDTKTIAAAVDDFLKQDENAGLRASNDGGRPAGDADAGKGAGAGAAAGDMNDYIRARSRRT